MEDMQEETVAHHCALQTCLKSTVVGIPPYNLRGLRLPLPFEGKWSIHQEQSED